ncbi:transposase, partial [Streptomyces sp. NPDC002547]
MTAPARSRAWDRSSPTPLPRAAPDRAWDRRPSAPTGRPHTVSCPRGRRSASRCLNSAKPTGNEIIRVHFAKSGCGACPVRAQCTSATNPKHGRSFTLRERGLTGVRLVIADHHSGLVKAVRKVMLGAS